MLRTREQVRVLGPTDRDSFVALAEQDPVVNVFADYRARLTNLDERWLGGQVHGRFVDGELVAACHMAANLVPVENEFVLSPTRHYFLTSGYVFNLGENIKFKPSFLLKEDFKGPTNLDLNAFVLFAERIWVGSSYRTGLELIHKVSTEDKVDMSSAWAGIVELYITPKLKLGYAYDVTLTGLNNYDSHEISLGFFFLKKEETNMLSPRYF